MKTILVTGGAGFLGSNLTHRLLEQGHKVIVLDDLSTGFRTNLPEHERLQFIHWDVVQPWQGEVQEIYHLACAASPPKYQADPLQTLRTNFLGTTNMLELAKTCGASLVFSSTSEVYGDPDRSPQSESYWGNANSFGPRSCYDEGKRVAESLCYSYAEREGVRVRLARIFNTYGPRMAPDDGRVVSNFLVQALQNKPLTVYGEGKQTRSLCFVDDLVAGLQALMGAPGPNLEQPANLGNPHEQTVKEIAELAIQVCQSRSSITYHPLPQDDPLQRCPDITRARSWLGWSPEVPVFEGMQKTADYFRQSLALLSVSLKILVISTDYPPMKGGIAVLSHATALEFQRAGHEVRVLACCSDWEAARAFDQQQPFSTVRFSGGLPWRELQILPKVWGQLRNFKPDVCWSAVWYPAAVAVSYLAGPQIVQSVSTYGSEIFVSYADWKLRLKAVMAPWRRRVFDRCSPIFALSRYTREKILQLGAPAEKVQIVRGGVGRHWFDLEREPEGDPPVLLTVARLDEHKGHDRVIEALPAILQEFPQLRYVLVGPGQQDWPRLRRLAQELGVASQVEYRGPVPESELYQAYQRANLFIMASREVPNRLDLVEGFGLTFLEAAALGLPSVAGDSGGVPDAVEHEVSGLLVDPTSAPAIAQAVIRLLKDEPLRQRLGHQARQRALAEFTWPTLAGQMLDAFERELRKKRP